MEYCDGEIKIDIKLEATHFEDIDMPDFIDISKDLDVAPIKQEELIIKSESEDSCEDNK